MTHSELGVVFWNILYDHGDFFGADPQTARVNSFAQTLGSLGVAQDAVGLVEVHNDGDVHIGEEIARRLGDASGGNWTGHSRNGEELGIFGPRVQKAEVKPLPGNRKFMAAELDDVLLVLVHLSFGIRGGDIVRRRQISGVLDYIGSREKVVLMGDFNSLTRQASRRAIEQQGLRSVFHELGRKRSATIMTEKYRRRLPRHFKIATKFGLSPDDIYVRGVGVLGAGVFEGDSDHRGIWARLLNN